MSVFVNLCTSIAYRCLISCIAYFIFYTGIYTYPTCDHNYVSLRYKLSVSFKKHVSGSCKTEFFHLKNISKLRPMLSMSNAEILITAFITSMLNYCNVLLGGCSARLINKLQLVQNAAARVLTRTRMHDHISPVLLILHWLPIKHCIHCKHCIKQDT